MSRNLRLHAVRVDRFCARLNSGLAAVAFVLGLVAVVAATIRVEQDAVTQSATQQVVGEMISAPAPD